MKYDSKNNEMNFERVSRGTAVIRSRYGLDTLNSDVKSVLNYCREIINLEEEGYLNQKEAAYIIVDTMNYDSVDANIDILSLILEAGTLELPDNIIGGDVAKMWANFKHDLVEESEKFNSK